ncbi:hypothetical protein G4B88_020254 [Cannabis sativa]|uniref:Uncharacterized protein n=1 Tax=Cannabis sativa TaxID=3483 RepID=A0A7J6GU09_CANSA|nr:hypothetical protein G4B88_020254 [Cannabis sativa]
MDALWLLDSLFESLELDPLSLHYFEKAIVLFNNETLLPICLIRRGSRLVEDGGRHVNVFQKIFNSIPISMYWHRFFQLTTTEPKSVDESYGMFRNNFFSTEYVSSSRVAPFQPSCLVIFFSDKSALKVAKRKLGTHKREKKRSTLIFYAR